MSYRKIGKILHLQRLLDKTQLHIEALYCHLGQEVYDKGEFTDKAREIQSSLQTETTNERAIRERLAYARNRQICPVCETEQSLEHIFCAICGQPFRDMTQGNREQDADTEKKQGRERADEQPKQKPEAKREDKDTGKNKKHVSLDGADSGSGVPSVHQVIEEEVHPNSVRRPPQYPTPEQTNRAATRADGAPDYEDVIPHPVSAETTPGPLPPQAG